MINLNKPVMKEPNKEQKLFLLIGLYIVTLTVTTFLMNI
jgi:hypothetical protein